MRNGMGELGGAFYIHSPFFLMVYHFIWRHFCALHMYSMSVIPLEPLALISLLKCSYRLRLEVTRKSSFVSMCANTSTYT